MSKYALPAAQNLHVYSVALTSSWNLPSSHDWHAVLLSAGYCPLPHALHVYSVALVSSWNLPAPHAWHAVLLFAAYCPVLHV